MMNRASKISLILLLAAMSPAALAADAVSLNTGPSVGGAIFRMIGSLAIVIALFFGAAWLYRNGARFKKPGSNPRKLNVLEARSLGARQAIYVVAYEQQRLMIGVMPQGLTLLTHLPDGQQSETPTVMPVSFGEALMQTLGRK